MNTHGYTQIQTNTHAYTRIPGLAREQARRGAAAGAAPRGAAAGAGSTAEIQDDRRGMGDERPTGRSEKRETRKQNLPLKKDPLKKDL